MKKLIAWAAVAALACGSLSGCSETTRKSMGRDVNRAAAEVDQEIEEL